MNKRRRGDEERGMREGGGKRRWGRGRRKSRRKMIDGVHWAVVRGRAGDEV